ncbi:MAG: hypothetical protein AB2L26_06590 [Ignavibacteria bacterium]
MKITVGKLELLFSNICSTAYPYEWNENYITYYLMNELRKLFRNRIIYFNNWSKIVDWQSFKNTGKQETNYGDIALLVNVQFSSGEILKGVASLEAKRDNNDGIFKSFDSSQLTRILSNLPYSHLLLYTHSKYELQQKFPDESTWKSNMWVSPINTASQIVNQVSLDDSWKVLRTSFPLSMFFTSRIFWGLDLDFRKEIIIDIETGINKIINPSFLGVVNIYYENQQPVYQNLSDQWEQI